MCQLTPFTLPCCRRIYVVVKKISTCPDEWPRLKCPPELCLQIGTHESSSAEHKNEGVCWRCKALLAGITGEKREGLRPVIDQARLVEGLEETTPEQRRRRVEASGRCWFCMSDASKRSCDMCGVKVNTPRLTSTDMGPPPQRSKTSSCGVKRRQPASSTPSKRLKTDHSYSDGFMEAYVGDPALAGMASPFYPPYSTKINPIVDSQLQVEQHSILYQPISDRLPNMHTQNQYSSPQKHER